MTHDEAENFLAHYGKKGMKWGHRSANPKFGERGTFDREILKARAQYEAKAPGARDKVKSARSVYRGNRTAANKQALRSAKTQARQLDIQTSLRNIETGREVATSIIAAVGVSVALSAAMRAAGLKN